MEMYDAHKCFVSYAESSSCFVNEEMQILCLKNAIFHSDSEFITNIRLI